MPAGELVVLVGPSGCGKTTTLRMLNRLEEPTSGEILIHGADSRSVPAHELRRGIGYVIQQVGLFPHRTIADNIGTVPKLLGWDAKQIRPASTSWSIWSSSTGRCSPATPANCPAASNSGSA